MKWAAAVVLSLVSCAAWGQTSSIFPTSGSSPGLVGGRGCLSVNCTVLDTGKRPPLPTDDVTASIYPGATWRAQVNGVWQTWQNMANGAGSAVWQIHQDIPLPGDVIGLWMDTAVVHAAGGGTGHNTGDIITIQGGAKFVVTAAAGVITAVQALTTAGTVQNIYGVCSPTLSATPQLATTGTGVNATFDITIKKPILYGMRQITKCYTGNIMTVQRSDNSATTTIGFLSDGSIDMPTLATFTAGPLPLAEYTLATSGPIPGVSVWNDQGGAALNATQATIIQQPMVFAGRMCGNVPCLMFPSQGNAVSDAQRNATSLAIPALTVDGTNAVASMLGGMFTSSQAGGFWLNQVANPNFFGIDSNTQGTCLNANGASADNIALGTMIAEKPAVYQCAFKGGWGIIDTSFIPSQQTIPVTTTKFGLINSGTVVAGSTVALTASGCGLASATTATYTVTAADASNADPNGQAMIGLVATINAHTTLAGFGITAMTSPINSGWITPFVPVGSSCTWSFTGTGGVTMNTITVPNPVQTSGTFSGGFIGKRSDGANTGNSFYGGIAIVPWTMNTTQLNLLRHSWNHHFGIVPQPGVVILMVGASNFTGVHTPFLQNVGVAVTDGMARQDVALFNPSAPGQKLSDIDTTYWANTYLPIAQRVKSNNPFNNWAVISQTYNDLASPGTPTSMMTTIQSVAGKANLAGFKTLCSAEVMKNAGAYFGGGTMNTQMAAFNVLLLATPGNCDVVVDMQAKPIFAIPTGTWPYPVFEQFDAGTHLGAPGAALHGEMIYQALRSYLQ